MKALSEIYRTHQGMVSDRWTLFLPTYDRLFSAYRDKPVRLIEVGVQNGGSLEIWSKYFAQAQKLIGCDINPACANLQYDDPRVAIVIGDVNTDTAEHQITSHAQHFDIVIDDGSHLSSDIIKTFARYFPKVVDDGVFVVEDLHCSYWQEYEGGLHDPYSSISFFKLLADVVNHEHWGTLKKRGDLIKGITKHYGVTLHEELLSCIHSVEFVNSICIIRKQQSSDNQLGERIITGQLAQVWKNAKKAANQHSVAPDQSPNFWTNLARPPGELVNEYENTMIERDGQIAGLNQAVTERDGQIAGLNQAVTERDGQIAGLNQAVTERDGQIAGLNQAVIERDGQIAGLNQAVIERDGQIAGLNQAVTERDGQIAGLNQAVIERDGQIAGLNQAVTERDGQIAGLNQAVTERDGQIAGLNQAVTERDGQIAGLNQAVIERDGQIAGLNQAVTERDGQIAGLNQAVTERDGQIAGLSQTVALLHNSTSWRITAPLRAVASVVRYPKQVFAPTGGGLLVLPKHYGLRSVLVQRGHVFYRQYLKRSRLGRWIGHQVLKRGFVQPAELQKLAPVAHTVQRAEEEVPGVYDAPSEIESAVPGFHLSQPLNLEISDVLAMKPCINVILPSLQTKHMSGGPNTALLFAAMLAERGERIRLIACDAPAHGKEAALFPHMDKLLQRPVLRDQIELVDAFDRTQPTFIGANDLFFATAWWTAQIARYAVNKTLHKTLIYLIQDFEPILHEGSTFYARALETYGFAHIPVINTSLLLDHLVKEGAGRYADPKFAQNALSFEPALDRNYFFPDPDKIGQSGKKVLLFYARPTVARRNLYEIGVVALRQAVASGAIDNESWEVWAMGESLPPVALGNGVYLNPLPWMNYEQYAKRVRTADLMLSLMLSPHPSYPPIEMAASGKLVVTNSCSVKTAQRMRAFSPNIIVAEPTADSVTTAIQNAAGRINMGLESSDPSGKVDLPSNWNDSLNDTLDRLMQRIQTLRATPPSTGGSHAHGFPTSPVTVYESNRLACLSRRRRTGDYHQEAGLLSFVTSAYNTDPVFLEELGRSVFLQDGGTQFEWLILDNGSTREDTRHALQQLARHSIVRLKRVEDNLGIIGGMRFCLENAQGRYILPLDSDDLIELDCVHVLTRFIKENDYPPLLYTDEDKLSNEVFSSPYFKPDWDPVLFLHSCYIAHLCAINREKALELGLYSDNGAEGCHDWDSFIRFMNAGERPCHIPEVLYSWRMHSKSTAGNIDSKSYISASHQNTLQRFLTHSGVPNIDLVSSPLFNNNVDWWFRRQRVAPKTIQKIIVCTKHEANGAVAEEEGMKLNLGSVISDLALLVQRIDTELIHLCFQDIVLDNDEWLWDAMGLLELFPDAVMVGGILHDGYKIIDGPRVFGFGEGFDCPDHGRLLSDPGYGAKMFKPHTASAIPTGHCVIRADFIKQCMPELLEESIPVEMLGPWLGALALETQSRVIYSPNMHAKVRSGYRHTVALEEKAHFLSRFWHQIPDHRSYSPRLGLATPKAYDVVDPEENQEHLLRLQGQLMAYPNWLEMRLRRRAALYPVSKRPTRMTLITTIYEKTDMGLLDTLAESIVGQTVKVAQWVIVAHGSITAKNMKHVLGNAAGHWHADVIVEPQQLGIMEAMRRGLENANGEYIVPVDCDDLLTADAIQILISTIENRNQPDLIFSDEDLLVEGQPASPYLRSGFDPVMNMDSSYIWHLCAVKRESALALSLYTDQGATWCHDWDSVTRVANAGGRIEHVAEVLYHWRQHPGSTTNKAEGDSRSLDSVRYVLERQIADTLNPRHFYVAEWPINRGARELYIARRADDLPPFVWIGDAAKENDHCAEDNGILVFATNGVRIECKKVLVEVARLMELHPHLGAVGGLVEREDGVVVDGCFLGNAAGMLASPWIGKSSSYSGPYALAQKTQSVASTGKLLAFFRISALKQIGTWPLAAHEFCSDTAIQWCGLLSQKGWNVAFSPLIKARTGSIPYIEKRLRWSPNFQVPLNQSLIRYGSIRGFRK